MADSFGDDDVDEYTGGALSEHRHHHHHQSHHHHPMEEDDDQGVDVAEALRNMGSTGATGDAGLLHLANEVQMEDHHRAVMGSSGGGGGVGDDGTHHASLPPLGEEVAMGEGAAATGIPPPLDNEQNQQEPEIIGMMDVISLDCQRFLIDIKCTKASDFIFMNIGDLTDKYLEWRLKRDPDSQISTGSARIYLNKWRKRLRDEIEKENTIKVEELGVLQDYTVANPQRIAKAQKEREKREKAAGSPNGRPQQQQRIEWSPLIKSGEVKFVNLSLSEPGTFGLKVENTLSNGVRISDVVPGLQGQKAGFEKGDIVAAATMDPANFVFDENEYNGKDMAFDDFVKVAQSEKRPILVRVRRGGPTDEMLEKIRMKTPGGSGKKRGRPQSSEGGTPSRKKGRKRTKISPHALHKMEVKRIRTMREEIVRAHNLRLAADAVEKSVTGTLIGFPGALKKVKDVAQTMREEAYELWDNPNHGEWEGHLKDLLVFKQLSGHFNVPKTHPDKELLKFLANVRATRRSLNKGEYKKNKRKDQAKVEIDIFDQIGFSWKTSSASRTWDDMLQELVSYKELHGTCVIPKQKKGAAYRNLYLWVNQQRKKFENKALPDSQIQRLNEIGMVWNLKAQKSWDDHLEDLLEYKLKNGNCKVPAVYKPNRPLGKWVDKMRQEKKKRDLGQSSTILTDERIKMLDYFGFSWEEPPSGGGSGGTRSTSTTPRKRYVDFDSEDDDDEEESEDDDDYDEGERRRSVKPIKRKSRGSTGSAGPGRPSLGKSWEEYYEDLVEYQREHGDTKVPQNYAPNRSLGSWVSRMRQQRKKDGVMPGDILTEERIQKLDVLGFVWNARGPGRPPRRSYEMDDGGAANTTDLLAMDLEDGTDGVMESWPKRNVVLKHDLFAKVSGKDFGNMGQGDMNVGEGVKEEGPMEVDISDKLAGKKSSKSTTPIPNKALLSDVYHGRYKMINEAKEGEIEDSDDEDDKKEAATTEVEKEDVAMEEPESTTTDLQAEEAKKFAEAISGGADAETKPDESEAEPKAAEEGEAEEKPAEDGDAEAKLDEGEAEPKPDEAEAEPKPVEEGDTEAKPAEEGDVAMKPDEGEGAAKADEGETEATTEEGKAGATADEERKPDATPADDGEEEAKKTGDETPGNEETKKQTDDDETPADAEGAPLDTTDAGKAEGGEAELTTTEVEGETFYEATEGGDEEKVDEQPPVDSTNDIPTMEVEQEEFSETKEASDLAVGEDSKADAPPPPQDNIKGQKERNDDTKESSPPQEDEDPLTNI